MRVRVNQLTLRLSKRINLDADGDFIDEWPDGFFVESFNENFGGR
jgi:hypothetical protein